MYNTAMWGKLKLRLSAVILVSFFVASQSLDAGAGCALPVKQLPRYEPIFIVDNRLALPARLGNLEFKAKDGITVACPGKKNALETFRNKEELSVSCQGRDKVQAGGSEYAVDQLGCVKSISGEVKVKDVTCGAGNAVGVFMEMGFRVKNTFYPMIQICHDKKSSATLYAMHILYGGALVSSEHRKNRPSFQEGGLYETFSPDRQYKQPNQLAVLTDALGSSQIAYKYLNETALSRGHLAPNADFVLDAYQDLSFFYINTAPQWQDVNAGNWGSLEKVVRKHASKQVTDLQVITGTYGVLKLKDNSGALTEVYLYSNKNEKRLPVPEFFWKVVYDPATQAAMAFVSINNCFLDKITQKDMLCPDVCDKYGWGPGAGSSWHKIATGFVYCCEVAALRQAVPFVPKLRVQKPLVYNG